MNIYEKLEKDFPDIWKLALDATEGDKLAALILLKQQHDAMKTLGILPHQSPPPPDKEPT